MATTTEFDTLVIGGGPGGYTAALRSAQLQRRTALVERESLGGICLNWGCIPTKSLLHTAHVLRQFRHAGALGISAEVAGVDFGRVVARSREVAQRLNRGVAHLLRKAGVTVLQGEAAFSSAGAVEVRLAGGDAQRIQARHVVIATGARARPLSGLPFGHARVWSYREALAAPALPRTLVVVGAGAIGMEFASFYATLGTRVTLVEAQPRLLPSSDADVSRFVEQSFQRDGVAVRLNATVSKATLDDGGVRLEIASPAGRETLEAERVLVAIGLAANTEALHLEHTGVRVDRGFVVADAAGATADPAVHAIGDVTGAPMLAHRAIHQGMACAERIAGQPVDAHAHPLIPSCVYSHPQSAGVGLTEEQARAQRPKVRVGRFPLEANGKAIAIGEPSGFVKTIFDGETGELLGAHIVGPDAPELIHGFTLAASMEATEDQLIQTVFPHPTISEAMHESVLAAFGRPIHI
ncbi:dihydrolipoyl dehydrogenase [Pseudorhodoferax sp.]|uniref:dihydrolipoyl dehydrogenase n=1 Tax=Pseudorhodoferax sp. TaxID=1993553 RepID=UPI0039E39197